MNLGKDPRKNDMRCDVEEEKLASRLEFVDILPFLASGKARSRRRWRKAQCVD